MLEPCQDDLTFYPAYCFALSPTHNAWVPLTAHDVHALGGRPGFEGQNIYFHLNHPIRWVRLVGVVVALELVASRIIITLDDSSGSTISVICNAHQQVQADGEKKGERQEPTVPTRLLGISSRKSVIDFSNIDIGTVIKVKGGISTYFAQNQVNLEKISIVKSTTEEIKSWKEYADFYTATLARAWVLEEKDVKQARWKAESSDIKSRSRKVRRRHNDTSGAARPSAKTTFERTKQRFRDGRHHDEISGKVMDAKRHAERLAREQEWESRTKSQQIQQPPKPHKSKSGQDESTHANTTRPNGDPKTHSREAEEIRHQSREETLAMERRVQLQMKRDAERSERERIYAQSLRSAR